MTGIPGRCRPAERLALAVVATLATLAVPAPPVTGAGPAPASAQTIRVTGRSWVRYVDVRGLVVDSVPVSETTGDGLLRATSDGRVARCFQGVAFCQVTAAGDRLSTIPFTQDLSVSVWGLGRGIRAYGRVRGRAVLGGESELWPRADEPVEVVQAYAELNRRAVRARLGRQWKGSGLGLYSFDGASLRLRPVPTLAVEGFGGWSLVRGLDEPITGGALEAVESFVPASRGILVGGQVDYRPRPGTSVSALYQREVRDDGLALYSERAALDGAFRAGAVTVEAGLEHDFAVGDLNEARFQLRAPIVGPLQGAAFARRYRPYFDLWTIWGAFSPVGYDEAGAELAWAGPAGSYDARVHGAWRRYPESDAGLSFAPFRSDGWRLGAVAGLRVWTNARLEGSYRADVGFGAARNDASLGLSASLRDGTQLSARAVLFQQAHELRVAEGSVAGFVASGSRVLRGRARATGSLAVYRHLADRRGPGPEWNQLRGSLGLEWTLGPEPGTGGGTP